MTSDRVTLARPFFNGTWLVAIAALSASPAAFCDDGDFDNGFGIAGTATTATVLPVDINAQVLHKVTTQVFADGSVAISGLRPHRISKFLLGGTPDPEFGVGGTTAAPDGPQGESGTGFIRTPTGELFSMAVKAGGAGVVVCRFDQNGQAVNFVATATPCVNKDFGAGPQDADWPQSLAVDAQGGIVVLARDAKLLRFHGDGTPDNAIGPNGVFAIEPASTDALFHTLEDIEIEGDSIYLTGRLEEEGVRTDGIVHKFSLSPGQAPTRDAQFNEGSYQLVACANESTPRCVLRDATLSGNYLAVAGTGQYSGDFGTVVRLDKVTGVQDGPVAILEIAPSPQTIIQLHSIAAQSNGDFIVAGTLNAGPNAPYDEVLVARVRAACGVPLVPGFGPNGSSLFTFDVDRFSAGTSVSIGDGRVYVAGFTNTNGPIVESVSALENGVAFWDGIFAHDFELPCGG